MVQMDFLKQAEQINDDLVAMRRDFHQHPEIAFEEVRTAGIVAKTLGDLGLEVQTGIGKTGVVGILEGAQDGPTVLVRADMDALPMQELNDVAYASAIPGKMHACGHDGHTTIALGVARLLAGHRDKIAGRVKFVFQPAEEIGAGALAMVDDGVMQNPAPDVVIGLHLMNNLPVGKACFIPGPLMAGASEFTITLTGKGGHGAIPSETIDPVVCAAQLVTAFQTIVSRNADPRDPLALSVTQIHTGSAHNIIPQTAEINGTFRTFTLSARDMVQRRMDKITQGIATGMGCEYEIEFQHSTDPVTNDPEVMARLQDVAKPYFDDDAFIEMRMMWGEDVGVFMRDVPGAFFFLGSNNAERGLDYGHHHPRFDFDERVLPLGVAVMASAVADYLIKS